MLYYCTLPLYFTTVLYYCTFGQPHPAACAYRYYTHTHSCTYIHIHTRTHILYTYTLVHIYYTHTHSHPASSGGAEALLYQHIVGIVGLFCPYRRSLLTLLTLVWSTGASLSTFSTSSSCTRASHPRPLPQIPTCSRAAPSSAIPQTKVCQC